MFDNDNALIAMLSAARYIKMPLQTLTPTPYNPRVDLQPEDPDYQRIKQSIIAHGMLQPIICNEQTGYLVGGNQRLKVLLDMGITEATCAVVNMPPQDEEQAVIALNRLGNQWDDPKLREVMLDLQQSGADMESTGFTPAEIERLTMEVNASVASFFEDDPEQTGKKEKKIRCINLVGSALLTLYGVMLDAFSMYTLNGILCLVHLYHLYKLARTDSKNKQTTHRR